MAIACEDDPEMDGTKARGWKARLLEEFRGYWLTVAYLALMSGAFVQYRRVVLASDGIERDNYFVALIKQRGLDKAIILGDAVRLARGMARRPASRRRLR